jgi:hypothetical protein
VNHRLGVADPACQCVELVDGILLLVSCWREELKRRIDPLPSEAEGSKTGRREQSLCKQTGVEGEAGRAEMVEEMRDRRGAGSVTSARNNPSGHQVIDLLRPVERAESLACVPTALTRTCDHLFSEEVVLSKDPFPMKISSQPPISESHSPREEGKGNYLSPERGNGGDPSLSSPHPLLLTMPRLPDCLPGARR